MVKWSIWSNNEEACTKIQIINHIYHNVSITFHLRPFSIKLKEFPFSDHWSVALTTTIFPFNNKLKIMFSFISINKKNIISTLSYSFCDKYTQFLSILSFLYNLIDHLLTIWEIIKKMNNKNEFLMCQNISLDTKMNILLCFLNE